MGQRMYVNDCVIYPSVCACLPNISNVPLLVPLSLDEETASSHAPGIKLGRFQVNCPFPYMPNINT